MQYVSSSPHRKYNHHHSLNSSTDLQLALTLGNLMRDSKTLLNQMYQFSVTCSYYGILRFKMSAALAASREVEMSGVNDSDPGLIQIVADRS